MKMEQTECSETSAYKIQTPGTYPEENIQHSSWNDCSYGCQEMQGAKTPATYTSCCKLNTAITSFNLLEFQRKFAAKPIQGSSLL